MCGIAGIWAPDLSPRERAAHVSRMLQHLEHRGPSGVALWGSDGVTLGLARLAIVAPRLPACVLATEDGSVHAVVNGEIYNHGALRAALERRGHRIEGGPDTAVIPHLYEDEGVDFPIALDGMFAVAVWDARARKLLLARDRAGEKPLFVADAAGRRAFASEPGALAALPWVSRDPAPDSIARYLAHGFFAGEDCAFAGVRQLPPAHVLELDGRGERRTRYWRPWDALGETRGRMLTVREAPAATLAALENAVAARIPDEVPFGVFLSGGVDSGMIAVLAARALGRAFPTFSLRLPDRGYDESAFARRVASSVGWLHHELIMDAASGEEALELYASGMDQPLGDPSVLPTWALARLAAQYVPVVLTGEGGDELFAGYPTYLGHRYAALASRMPEAVRAAAIAIARRLRPAHFHVSIPHMAERFLAVAAMPPLERHLTWFGTATESEAHALLSRELRARVASRAALGHLDSLASDLEDAGLDSLLDGHDLALYQILDFEFYLSGDLLAKVDRAAMAHGLESRAPFLQHGLIEFALGLPERAKLRGATGKWALKQAARGLLPADLLRRRKQGFSPPFSAWARGPMRASVTARLARERIERAGVLDPSAVTALLDAHLEGRTERGRTVWALLSLQMWAERWQERPSVIEVSAPARAAALAAAEREEAAALA